MPHKINKLTSLTEPVKEELSEVWEKAVRSSHHFLTEQDLNYYRSRMKKVNSTHKCNLSVRPFVMVAKLAKKYSGEVRMPSFFLGLLFNLFRMKIIERTVLRTFSLGKSPINPHVNFFPRCLHSKRPGSFTISVPRKISYAPLFLFFNEVFTGL